MKRSRQPQATAKQKRWARALKQSKKNALREAQWSARRRSGFAQVDIRVNAELLAPHGMPPDFLIRGYYVDMPFNCRDCGKADVWTSTQQKWWYEVAKGSVKTRAIRCRSCRSAHRAAAERSRQLQTARGKGGQSEHNKSCS
ncbi:MAG: zinc-ribbon domain containing protein [Rhodocyclaceae bacterium]|nr:zinc-ribbon domain containing protein [Rhodocyclaceae bacterium]